MQIWGSGDRLMFRGGMCFWRHGHENTPPQAESLAKARARIPSELSGSTCSYSPLSPII